jgi:Tfp pilus assembly protein FimV
MVIQFLKEHERLAIVVIIAALIWIGYGKVEGIIAAHDQSVLAQQKLITDAQVKQNAALAVQVQQDAANLQALQTKLETQNAQLVQANTQLAAALSRRQQSDANLPLPDLAARWIQLVPQASLTSTSAGISVSPTGAVATVQALEQIPTLQQELTNETAQKQNADQVIAQQTTSITDLTKQVTGLNLQIVDQTKQCTDQIAVVRAQAAKSKRRWFIIGYIAGFMSKVLLK